MLKKVSATLAAVLVAVAVQVTGQAAVAHADAAGRGGDFVSLPSAPVVAVTSRHTSQSRIGVTWASASHQSTQVTGRLA